MGIVHVQRRAYKYLWNVALPLMTFVTMAFMTFFVPPEDVADRLGLSLTLVLTSAAYKFVVAGMLPAIGYKTMLDWYVEVCAFFQFIIVIENGVMSTPSLQPYDTVAQLLIAIAFILSTTGFAALCCWLDWRMKEQHLPMVEGTEEPNDTLGCADASVPQLACGAHDDEAGLNLHASLWELFCRASS